MRKYLKKLLIGSSLTTIGLAGLLILFVLYPGNLFAKRASYRAFDIYADAPLRGDYRAVLDGALDLVVASELYNSDYRCDIFLTEGSVYKDITFKLMGPAMARSLDNNILLNTKTDFGKNLLAGPANKRDLTRTIAHEMVHCFQLHRYGIRKFNPVSPPPLWKLEGYPEYIAYGDEIRAPGYSLVETVDRLQQSVESGTAWVEIKPGHSDPIVYLKGRVLMEYLMDVKGLTYDQVLDEKIREENVYRELLEWCDARTSFCTSGIYR